MDDSQLIAFMTGVLAPNLIAVIQRRTWSHEVRHMVALASYVVIALGVWWFQNDLSFDAWGWRDYFRVLAPVIIGGVSSFEMLWRKTTAPVIETATTPKEELVRAEAEEAAVRAMVPHRHAHWTDDNV